MRETPFIPAESLGWWNSSFFALSFLPFADREEFLSPGILTYPSQAFCF
jgi:hypothetical protein